MYYKNGNLDGEYVYYYENGKLWYKGQYSYSKKSGLWLKYDRDGNIEKEDNY